MNEGNYCCGNQADDERLALVPDIVNKYKNIKGPLIPVLHEIQSMFGYLPEPSLKIASEILDISMSEIYGVATFYSQFNLEPKGEHIIKVCLGTACYVKGSQEIIEKISSELDVEVGKTTKDGKFTLEAARCLGACGLAPVMTIDDKVYGRLVTDDVSRILKEYI
ncbi:MAG: NADH-quinone oxidoreductase subunit NuoE [Clostridiaceae bacterium]